MPMYNYKCPSCALEKRKIFSNEEAANKAEVECPKCGAILRRNPGSPSTQITETLDNGVMGRKVERLADAERIFYERAHPDQKAIK